MTDRPTLRVLYPGSFDPIHRGHVDVVEQAHELFGIGRGRGDVQLRQAVAACSTSNDRLDLASAVARAPRPNVVVEAHTGLADRRGRSMPVPTSS